MASHGLNFSSIIRDNDARLAHNSVDDFQMYLEVVKPHWLEIHGRRASFNWDIISEKLISALEDVMGDEAKQQITSHDLLTLHEHLNRLFRTSDNSVACSDACQVALDMAIKSQHSPRPEKSSVYAVA